MARIVDAASKELKKKKNIKYRKIQELWFNFDVEPSCHLS